jgi:hypothetical protein
MPVDAIIGSGQLVAIPTPKGSCQIIPFSFWIFELNLLGADTHFKAHFKINNQQSSIGNHQSSSRFAWSEAPPR